MDEIWEEVPEKVGCKKSRKKKKSTNESSPNKSTNESSPIKLANEISPNKSTNESADSVMEVEEEDSLDISSLVEDKICMKCRLPFQK